MRRKKHRNKKRSKRTRNTIGPIKNDRLTGQQPKSENARVGRIKPTKKHMKVSPVLRRNLEGCPSASEGAGPQVSRGYKRKKGHRKREAFGLWGKKA